MDLYLMRHADAVNVGEEGATCDEERALSPKGRKQAKRMGEALKAMGCAPERVLSSPLVRARETADIAARVMGVGVEEVGWLVSGTTATEMAREARKREERSLLLVGHMPDLGDFGGYAVCGDTRMGIGLKKGAVLLVSFDGAATPGAGRLEWLLRPDIVKCLQTGGHGVE